MALSNMVHFQDDESSSTPKKRYSTPLYVEEMLKSDSQRRESLIVKAHFPETNRNNRFLLPYEQNCWFIPDFSSGHDVRTLYGSGNNSGVMRNDAGLLYERSHPRRDSSYWRFNFDQPDWAGLSPVDEDAADERVPANSIPHQIGRNTSRDLSGDRTTHRLQTTNRRPEQSRPPSYSKVSSNTRRHHVRGYSLPSCHPVFENDQTYHPHLDVKRPESVPNYSRPWTPDFIHTRKRASSCNPSSIKSKSSDRSISYERVNGVCLDTRPSSPNNGSEGLSIPEIEARDIMKIDHWLDKHTHTEHEFPSSISHPARSPPPIGYREETVRAISPQPPNSGRNHTFVSRYSWTTEELTTGPEMLLDGSMLDASDDESAPPPSISLSRESEEYGSEASSRADQARALLTEIIKGLFGSPKGCSHFTGTAYYGECNQKFQPGTCGGYSANRHDTQLHKGAGGYWHKFSFSSCTRDPSPPRSRCRYYSEQTPYRRRMGLARRGMMRMITLRPLRVVEEV